MRSCQSEEIHRNRKQRRTELVLEIAKVFAAEPP